MFYGFCPPASAIGTENPPSVKLRKFVVHRGMSLRLKVNRQQLNFDLRWTYPLSFTRCAKRIQIASAGLRAVIYSSYLSAVRVSWRLRRLLEQKKKRYRRELTPALHKSLGIRVQDSICLFSFKRSLQRGPAVTKCIGSGERMLEGYKSREAVG